MRLSSYGICLFATLISVVLAQDNAFVRQRDEYCTQGNLCLTSFDWCWTTRANSGNGSFNVGFCDSRSIMDDDRFLVSEAIGVANGVTIFYAGFYNLTWINADPNYPVQVDLFFGPSEGPINNTVPTWTQNVTDTYYQFRPLDIYYELNSVPGVGNVSYAGYSLGWTNRFVISQPERPAVDGINATAVSDGFRVIDLTAETAIRDNQRRDERAQEEQIRRWRLGVGVGVGVGVPLLLLIAFIAGRIIGKKSGIKAAKKPSPQVKESSDFSDGDRPVVAG